VRARSDTRTTVGQRAWLAALDEHRAGGCPVVLARWSSISRTAAVAAASRPRSQRHRQSQRDDSVRS